MPHKLRGSLREVYYIYGKHNKSIKIDQKTDIKENIAAPQPPSTTLSHVSHRGIVGILSDLPTTQCTIS